MLAWWVLGGSLASACSCGPVTDDEAFDHADAVFIATLQEVRLPDDIVTFSSADPARFVFVVSTVFKGEVFEQQSVVTARDGASCGLEIGVGQTVLVFARADIDPGVDGGAELAAGELSSNLCSGTRTLAGAPVPDSFGEGTGPVAGSSGVGDGGRWYLDADVWWGAALVAAMIGLAIAGIFMGRRARSTGG